MAKEKFRARHGVAAAAACVLMLAAIGAGLAFLAGALVRHTENPDVRPPQETTTAATETTTTAAPPETTTETTTVTTSRYPEPPVRTDRTITVADTSLVYARSFILVECAENGGTVLAEREPEKTEFPASLTKLMTLVTFLELKPDVSPDTVVTMEQSAIDAAKADYLYVAGFSGGEPCTVRDLLYAMMLPSGADAALMLAQYAAGSEELFVAEMNRLASEIGLTHSCFVNCTGVHNDAHTTTVSDIALLLQYALKDPICTEILSTRTYRTAATEAHPEGMTLQSTTLWRMNGGELDSLPDPLAIRGGKTGFTRPAGQCLATFAESAAGKRYICVLIGSTVDYSMDAMSDTLTIYQLTGLPAEGLQRFVLREEDILDPPAHF